MDEKSNNNNSNINPNGGKPFSSSSRLFYERDSSKPYSNDNNKDHRPSYSKDSSNRYHSSKFDRQFQSFSKYERSYNSGRKHSDYRSYEQNYSSGGSSDFKSFYDRRPSDHKYSSHYDHTNSGNRFYGGKNYYGGRSSMSRPYKYSGGSNSANNNNSNPTPYSSNEDSSLNPENTNNTSISTEYSGGRYSTNRGDNKDTTLEPGQYGDRPYYKSSYRSSFSGYRHEKSYHQHSYHEQRLSSLSTPRPNMDRAAADHISSSSIHESSYTPTADTPKYHDGHHYSQDRSMDVKSQSSSTPFSYRNNTNTYGNSHDQSNTPLGGSSEQSHFPSRRYSYSNHPKSEYSSHPYKHGRFHSHSTKNYDDYPDRRLSYGSTGSYRERVKRYSSNSDNYGISSYDQSTGSQGYFPSFSEESSAQKRIKIEDTSGFTGNWSTQTEINKNFNYHHTSDHQEISEEMRNTLQRPLFSPVRLERTASTKSLISSKRERFFSSGQDDVDGLVLEKQSSFIEMPSVEQSVDEDEDTNQNAVEQEIDMLDMEISHYEDLLNRIREETNNDSDKSLEEELIVPDVAEGENEELSKAEQENEPIHAKIYRQNRQTINKNVKGKLSLLTTERPHVFTDRIYSSFTQYDFYRKNMETHEKNRHFISKLIGKEKRSFSEKYRLLRKEYKSCYESWKKTADKLDQKIQKNLVKSPAIPSPSNQIGGVGQPSEFGVAGSSRRDSSRRANFASDAVRSEAEWQAVLASLGIVEQADDMIRYASVPEMSLDPLERRRLQYICNDHLVTDPLADLKSHNELLVMKWSLEDRELFKSKLGQHGKAFNKISSFFPTKTTADCVHYYYREKMKLSFKSYLKKCAKLKRKQGGLAKLENQAMKNGGHASILKRYSGESDVIEEQEFDDEDDGEEIQESTILHDQDMDELLKESTPTITEPDTANSFTIVAPPSNQVVNNTVQSSSNNSDNGGINNPTTSSSNGHNTTIQEDPSINNKETSSTKTAMPKRRKQNAKALKGEDKVRILEALYQQGTDFDAISSVVGNRSLNECQNFYEQYLEKLRLEECTLIANLEQQLILAQETKDPESINANDVAALEMLVSFYDVEELEKMIQEEDSFVVEDHEPVENDMKNLSKLEEQQTIQQVKAVEREKSSNPNDESLGTKKKKKTNSSKKKTEASGNSGSNQLDSAATSAPSTPQLVSAVQEKKLHPVEQKKHEEFKPEEKQEPEHQMIAANIPSPKRSSTPKPVHRVQPEQLQSSISLQQQIKYQKLEQQATLQHQDSSGSLNNGQSGSRRTVSYWSVAEKAEFLKALAKYGRNWEMISKQIGSKSAIQNRNYYHNFRQRLELDRILEDHGHSIEDEKPSVISFGGNQLTEFEKLNDKDHQFSNQTVIILGKEETRVTNNHNNDSPIISSTISSNTDINHHPLSNQTASVSTSSGQATSSNRGKGSTSQKEPPQLQGSNSTNIVFSPIANSSSNTTVHSSSGPKSSKKPTSSSSSSHHHSQPPPHSHYYHGEDPGTLPYPPMDPHYRRPEDVHGFPGHYARPYMYPPHLAGPHYPAHLYARDYHYPPPHPVHAEGYPPPPFPIMQPGPYMPPVPPQGGSNVSYFRPPPGQPPHNAMPPYPGHGGAPIGYPAMGRYFRPGMLPPGPPPTSTSSGGGDGSTPPQQHQQPTPPQQHPSPNTYYAPHPHPQPPPSSVIGQTSSPNDSSNANETPNSNIPPAPNPPSVSNSSIHAVTEPEPSPVVPSSISQSSQAPPHQSQSYSQHYEYPQQQHMHLDQQYGHYPPPPPLGYQIHRHHGPSPPPQAPHSSPAHPHHQQGQQQHEPMVMTEEMNPQTHHHAHYGHPSVHHHPHVYPPHPHYAYGLPHPHQAYHPMERYGTSSPPPPSIYPSSQPPSRHYSSSELKVSPIPGQEHDTRRDRSPERPRRSASRSPVVKKEKRNEQQAQKGSSPEIFSRIGSPPVSSSFLSKSVVAGIADVPMSKGIDEEVRRTEDGLDSNGNLNISNRSVVDVPEQSSRSTINNLVREDNQEPFEEKDKENGDEYDHGDVQRDDQEKQGEEMNVDGDAQMNAQSSATVPINIDQNETSSFIENTNQDGYTNEQEYESVAETEVHNKDVHAVGES